MDRIDSQKHPTIQTLREIQTEKGREQLGFYHVEGRMVVSRALDYGGRVAFLVCTNRFASSPESQSILTAAEASRVAIYEMTEGLMSKVVPGKPPPEVVACVERRLQDPAALLELRKPLLVLVDRCDNPDNLGMLLRSLDAAGVDGLALTSDCADPFSRLSVRASRGSTLSLRLSVVANPEDWLAAAQAQGFEVVASSAHGAESIWETDFRGPVVIVVGNEHDGVRQSIRSLADHFVRIPMAGRMESLNIAVAGAVIAYEAARQRSLESGVES